MSISSTLISWYLQKKRNLPWRNSANPYHIWISEVVLQQTRVAQGLSYYERFITSFPDIKSLAKADIQDVLKVWQGLGYYSRARNLHAGAFYVLQQLKGTIPANYEELLKIKGVGEYTAAAIASFAFDIPVPVVDGNVNRVISRIFGVHDPINATSGVKEIKKIAGQILDRNTPGLHNQAIMEFGALQCTIKNPDCGSCPFSSECYAYQHNEVSLLPVKLKLQKIRKRYFHYLVILHQEDVYLQKRSKKDIWQGLYEFPLIETDTEIEDSALTSTREWASLFEGSSWEIQEASALHKHLLTHQTIYARFYLVISNKNHEMSGQSAVRVAKKDIHQFPVSKLIENYIATTNW